MVKYCKDFPMGIQPTSTYNTYIQVLLNSGSNIRLDFTNIHTFIQTEHYKSMK